MKKNLLTVLTAVSLMAFAAVSSEGKVTLPHFFGDNMVLQRETDAKIWGTAEANATVTVTPSWDGKSVTVEADKDGKWRASVSTPAAGGPYSIDISDGEKLTLENVLIGEVWLCSGQSNMDMRMMGRPPYGQPVEGSAYEILKANPDSGIRVCTVERKASFGPEEDCEAQWRETDPETVANTSAVAYFFAQCMREVLRVPIGVIVSSWGGSNIIAWMDRATLAGDFPEVDLSSLDGGELPKDPTGSPSFIYNGMMSPLVGYTIRGMLWYQGESNDRDPEQYLSLQPAFVSMLRHQWRAGIFPFYYVQIAPHSIGNPKGDRVARVREAQMKALELIPNSGMVVTLDIGDNDCAHPAKKREVGQRLAFLALTQTYGISGIDPYPPTYESWKVVDGKIIVSFKVFGSMGLAPMGKSLDGFEVAGVDRVFHPASAKIRGRSKVEVVCPEVTDPVAVRYEFHNSASASLFNCSGIPASPFRTDDW